MAAAEGGGLDAESLSLLDEFRDESGDPLGHDPLGREFYSELQSLDPLHNSLLDEQRFTIARYCNLELEHHPLSNWHCAFDVAAVAGQIDAGALTTSPVRMILHGHGFLEPLVFPECKARHALPASPCGSATGRIVKTLREETPE